MYQLKRSTKVSYKDLLSSYSKDKNSFLGKFSTSDVLLYLV